MKTDKPEKSKKLDFQKGFDNNFKGVFGTGGKGTYRQNNGTKTKPHKRKNLVKSVKIAPFRKHKAAKHHQGAKNNKTKAKRSIEPTIAKSKFINSRHIPLRRPKIVRHQKRSEG